jgi:hypothetical protein
MTKTNRKHHDRNNGPSLEKRFMKHFQKYILPSILTIIVLVGAAASFYSGKLSPNPANAEDKPDKLAKQISADVSEGSEISTLLKQMDLRVSADNSMMPDFELLDLDGKVVQLSDYRGSTVLLGFFTTW